MTVRPETVFGGSRFDFFIRDAKGHEGFLEVKGVTLENEGVASFPDAPTERGVKHLKELTVAAACGYLAYLLFVIQMEDVRLFTPNDKCHAAFGEALRDAAQKGVCILAHACSVTPFSLSLGKETEIQL